MSRLREKITDYVIWVGTILLIILLVFKKHIDHWGEQLLHK